MPLVFRYSDPGGAEEPATIVDLGNTVTTVRLGTLAISQAAELGDAATWGLEIEDPDATLDLVGLRGFGVVETSAPSNSRWIASGAIGDQRISRGGSNNPSIRLGTSRVWNIDIVDQNWSLGVSIITGSDGNRPAETAGERLRWVIREYSRVKDFGHVTYPTDRMDAADYRHQTVKDVIADCAIIGGYNYFADRFEAQNRAELFFMLPTSSDYASTISISNVYADVDGVTVFAPAIEAELHRSPSRITYGVDLQYDGGSVYVTDPTTGAQFAYVDQSAPMANVKSSAKATVIANRFLADNDEQDERVTCSIKVPAAQVNDLRHGHRTTATFEHLPGWESARPCRVLRRTVAQELAGGEAWYRLDLELTPIGTGGTYTCSAALAAMTSDTDSDNYHNRTTASVASTVSDGALVGIVIAENGNTPASTNMNAPSGYTELVNQPAYSRATWSIVSRVVSAGTYTLSSTWTPGFGGASAGDVWIAAQAWLPWTAATKVQDKSTGARLAGFDSAPTAGNTIVMFAICEDGPVTPGGTIGPTTGWTELFTASETNDNCHIHVTAWARCVAESDGDTYEWNGGTGVLMGQATYIVEFST